MSDLKSLRPLDGLDRRGFVTAALIGGFATAALPISATTITTNTSGLEAGETRIPVSDGVLPAYFARPAVGKNFPVVLVVQEIFGVHEHIRDVCRRFAKRGVLAIVPELFARQGNPAVVPDIQTLMRDIVSKVSDQSVMDDLDATVKWARRERGTGKVGVTGFCWGGRITWLYAAHSIELAAGVAWYGRLVGQPSALQPKHPVDVAASLKAPVLGVYAGRDGGIPMASVERMTSALATPGSSIAAKVSRIDVYPEAQHGFYADYRASYRADDAEPAFRSALDWFVRNGLDLQPPERLAVQPS
ncbi:MAG: dienelactone hydrolase family protein [Gammaproteobacteria bacterium]|nr:dienelactone hydrolase family protein [Gammaproteobacteria bacterium]